MTSPTSCSRMTTSTVRLVLAVALLLTILSLLALHPPTEGTIISVILNSSASSVARLRLLAGVEWDNNNISTVYSVRNPNDDEYYDYDITNRSVNELVEEYEQHNGDDVAAIITTRNVTYTSWQETMETRFAERLATLKTACRKYNNQLYYSVNKTLKSHLFYSKKYKLMVCAVAKAGSTTWKTHLLSMRGVTSFKQNVHFMPSLRAEYQLGVDGTRKVMSRATTSTTRVMNARHPLDRLVSAYRDKFHDGHTMTGHRAFKKMALKGLGRQAEKTSAVSFTFSEFLTFVLNQQRKSKEQNGVNPHWKNYYRTCSPCALHFDYIVNMETYSEDLHYIVQRIGATEVNVGRREHTTNSNTSYSDYYRHVEPSLLKEIYRFYKIDIEMFGYDIPDFLKKIISQNKDGIRARPKG